MLPQPAEFSSTQGFRYTWTRPRVGHHPFVLSAPKEGISWVLWKFRDPRIRTYVYTVPYRACLSKVVLGYLYILPMPTRCPPFRYLPPSSRPRPPPALFLPTPPHLLFNCDYSFGATPAPVPASGTTSLFGATQPAAAPAASAPTSAFGFGAAQPAPAPAPSAFGGTFGAAAAAAPAPSAFGAFGATPAAAAPAPSGFGAFGGAAPAPATTGSLFGAAPAAAAAATAAGQPQEITPETRYADLPEAARKKIDEMAKEIKR